MRTQDATDPINQLYGEHDHALTQLQVLRVTAHAMAKSGVNEELLTSFRSALRFLDHEVRVHNQWEEDNLFPLLEKVMGPGGPCAVMRAEHRMLWDAYAAIGPVLERAQSSPGDAENATRLAAVADEIVDLLAAHIHKENEVLFPMARRMLASADFQRMTAAREATAAR